MSNFIERLFSTEHQRVQENLSAYLDGELDSRERAQVEKHLRECAQCRADLSTLRQTASLLRLMPEVALPRSFVIPVSEARRQVTSARPSPVYLLLRNASAMATLLFAIVLSGNLLLRAGFGGFLVGVSQPAPSYREAAPMVAVTHVVEEEKEVAVEEAPVVAAERAEASTALAMPKGEEAVKLEEPAPAESEKVRAAGEVTAKSLPVGVAPLGAGESPTGTLAAERALPTPEPPTPSPTLAPTPTVRAVELATPTGRPTRLAAYQAQPEATPTPSYAGSGQAVSRALDGAMWALLIAMVVLWAGTAILRPRR